MAEEKRRDREWEMVLHGEQTAPSRAYPASLTCSARVPQGIPVFTSGIEHPSMVVDLPQPWTSMGLLEATPGQEDPNWLHCGLAAAASSSCSGDSSHPDCCQNPVSVLGLP